MAKHYTPKHSVKSSAPKRGHEENLLPLDTGVIETHIRADAGQDASAYAASGVEQVAGRPDGLDAAGAAQRPYATAKHDEAADAFDPFAPRDEQPAQAAAAAAQSGHAPEADLARYRRGSASYKKRSHRGRKIAIAAIVAVVLIFGGLGGAAFAFWNNTQNAISIKDTGIRDELQSEVSVSEPFWTLILGSDECEGPSDVSGQRSDVILLARIDPASKRVTFVSIPRDSLVYINGHQQKINAAYSLGGAKQAIQTVEEYAGIDVSHYVEVNFSGFEQLVDQLGGITVDVPEYASYGGISLNPGVQELNGEQALMLARNRKTYTDGDFTRTTCQRLIAQAIVEKVLQKDPAELATLVPSIAQCFKTDMSLTDIVALANAMQGMGSESISMAMAPSTTGMIGDASYTFTYINQWKLLMQRASNGEDPTLTDKEAAVLGTTSTQTEKLDMSQPIPSSILKKLQDLQNSEKQEELSRQKQQSSS